MLDDLHAFIQIVDAGSLKEAARRMNIPAPTLTRRLRQLEEQLGCQLLHRSARQLSMTPEGLHYYEKCHPLFRSINQATQEIHASLNDMSGFVRVLAPLNLSNSLLYPIWQQFMENYPQISLELRLSNLNENVFELGGDLAIRLGKQPDSSMSQRLLGYVSFRLVASPDYVAQHSAIEQPEDLAKHDWLVTEPMAKIRLQAKNNPEEIFHWLPEKAILRVNEFSIALGMAKAGLGLLHVPLSQCAQALANGELVEILPHYRIPRRELYAIWPTQKLLPARVRAMLNLLVESLAKHPFIFQSPHPCTPSSPDNKVGFE